MKDKDSVIIQSFKDTKNVYSKTYKTPKNGKDQWWREGMVTGNGENGALVLGAPIEDVIIYQNILFNMPTNDLRDTPDISGKLEEVRQNLINNIPPKTDWNMQYDYTFHPAHQLRLKMGTKGDILEFCRWTNYETAEIGTTYADDLGTWERRTFASRADNVVITHIKSSSKGEKVNLKLSIDDLDFMSYENKKVDSNIRYKKIAGNNGNYIGLVSHYPEYENSELKFGGYAGVTYIINYGGAKKLIDLGNNPDLMAAQGSKNFEVEIENADEVYLITKSDRTFNMGKYEDFSKQENFEIVEKLVSDILKVIKNKEYYSTDKLDYVKMLTPHVKLHAKEYLALSLNLYPEIEDKNLSNEVLISKQKSNQTTINKEMLQRAFYAGRYAAVCSSGLLVPRLGGMWTGAWGSNWQGDWTTDANINLQISGYNIGNLKESFKGYINFILKISKDWVDNAKKIYGMKDALMAPPRTDADRGSIVHFAGSYPFQYWNAGVSWLILPIYEHYLCYGNQKIPYNEEIDLETLREVLDLTGEKIQKIKAEGFDLAKDILLPLLEKCANFWTQFVDARYYEDKDGNIKFDPDKKSLNEGEKYVFLPTYSPENTPLGTYQNPITINSTMDISAAKDALLMAINMEKEYGNNIEKIKTWEDLIGKLPSYKYDETGALREWAVDYYKENHGHRHISHTYSAWPAHESQEDEMLSYGISKSIALRKQNSSDKKSGHGWLHTGLVDARLKNDEGVREALLKLISENAYYSSFMTNHNVSGDSSYVTDILITLPTIVLESLVYSNEGKIQILPSLPRELNKGGAAGIMARTCAKIDNLSWDLDKRTVEAKITSQKAQTIKLSCQIPWERAEVTINGRTMVYDKEKTIPLNLNKGESAHVTFKLHSLENGAY